MVGQRCLICARTVYVPLIGVPKIDWKRHKLVDEDLKDIDEALKRDIRAGKLNGKFICAKHAPRLKKWKKEHRQWNENPEPNKEELNDEPPVPSLTPQSKLQPVVRQESPLLDVNDNVELNGAEESQSEWEENEEDEFERETTESDFTQSRFIIKGSMLMDLAAMATKFECICKTSNIQFTLLRRSTSAILKLRCINCEKQKNWSSHEKIDESRSSHSLLNRDIAVASTVSGLSYTRLLSMCKLIKLQFPSHSTQKRIMKAVGWDAVRTTYEKEQEDTMERIAKEYGGKNRAVDIEADGQYDSPGYSALICKVTAFETKTGLCMLSNTLHKKEEGVYSGGLEEIGVKKALSHVEDLGFTVKSITTDQSGKVGRLMQKEHGPTSKKPIRHYLDFWHLTKNVNNKILAALKKKKNGHLRQWRQAIINYLYVIRQVGNADPESIRELILGMLNHLVGIHEWPDDDRFRLFGSCTHGPLGEDNKDRTYLIPGSPSHRALLDIIDENFIKTMTRMSPYGSTSRVESFHSLCLIYTPKGNYVDKATYEARTLCAILRYNSLTKAELDGNRTVMRTVKVERKHRPGAGPTTKKIRMGGEEHGWMREIMDAARANREADRSSNSSERETCESDGDEEDESLHTAEDKLNALLRADVAVEEESDDENESLYSLEL